MIDLIKLEKEIKDCLEKYYGLEVEEVVKEEGLIDIRTGMSLPYCDDYIQLDILMFDDGRMIVDFIFDKLMPTFKTMKLINEVNKELAYVKAFIDEANYFHIQSNVSCNESVTMMVNNFQDAMDMIIWERAEELIKPITNLTFPDVEE